MQAGASICMSPVQLLHTVYWLDVVKKDVRWDLKEDTCSPEIHCAFIHSFIHLCIPKSIDQNNRRFVVVGSIKKPLSSRLNRCL